jgi:hypothetical protein
MSAAVIAPDPFATRAHAADWLELMALSSYPLPYRSAEYLSSLAMANDDPDGVPRHDGEDEEILDNEFDELLELATDEIRWREGAMGSLYPFKLKASAQSWTLTYARGGRAETRAAQDVYTVCLLMSSARHGRLDGIPKALRAVKTVADGFQAAVFLIAPALLGGSGFWIAFPRPEQDDYGPAIGRLVTELGVGKLTDDRPPTQTRNKDGGVDIITWRNFADQRSNLMLSYGQVATGKHWRDKSVKNKLESHFLRWLAIRPVKHYVPAMYIPHVMHEELRRSATATYEEMLKDDAHTLEALVGVVVDRVRMTLLTVDALRIREVGGQKGTTHVRALREWQRGVIDVLRRRP